MIASVDALPGADCTTERMVPVVSEPRLSVVIVTDGFETIRKTVRHLREQTVAKDIELVIVAPDGGLEPPEAELAELHSNQVVSVGDIRSLSWARAPGIRAARAPIVALQTWFRVGSRYEQPGKTGLAHFFEHMMFQETETLPYGEFDRLMDAAGGETNAATWIDWPDYPESLPADELPLAIQLESDRMAHLVVKRPQVESEREVVMNARRMAVGIDQSRLALLLAGAAFAR